MKPEFNKDIFKSASADPSKKLTTAEVTEKLKQDAIKARSEKGLFIVKKTSEWINESMKRPAPKMLFSEFWHEGELCILFADTNVGKSILAVQMGNSMAQGDPIHGFVLQADKKKVLYLDFELSDKQFELRYSDANNANHYQFCDNFLRAEINPDADLPEGKFEEYLHASLERSIKETKVEVLIVDNITYLRNETEKAKDALPLMKQLKSIKQKFNISILVLAHTPKRDQHKPITKNDLQGSKMLINFCDSAFAIGECQNDSGTRYLKQIKTRNTEFKYDARNVMVCRIEKPYNFLKFEFLHFADEYDLLMSRENSFEDKKPIARAMKEEGASIDDIMKKLNVSRGWVSNNTKDITSQKGRGKSRKSDSSEGESLLDLI